MAILYGITFAAAAPSLAEVVDNGVCVDDPRVMSRTNSAIKLLLDLGTWVNTMAIYDVSATGAAGTELFLPKELENAIVVEPLDASVNSQRDVAQGWYDLVNPMTYVDPSFAHDNPLDDLFLHPDPLDHTILRRKYNYPGLQPNAVVRVTGKKRYIPITTGSDTLIVQNVEAVRSAILYLEHKDRGAGSIDDATKYLADAKMILESEVKQHQLDPRRTLKRKAGYQSDVIIYAEGTLGRTRARLALELAGFLLRGKAEITDLVNRAVQMLVDNRNQLAIGGRLSVHGTTTELQYVTAYEAADVLAWGDYNQIRLMVQSFSTESGDPNSLTTSAEYQKRAFELQQQQLLEATELARHTTYTADLTEYVPGTKGWMVARLALELSTGLAMTDTELHRLVGRAEQRLMERGVWKGCLVSLTAAIHSGDILFPINVEAILSANICGMPTDIRSVFFMFQKNGPGGWSTIGQCGLNFCGCSHRFDDAGEVYFAQTGLRRRKYIYLGSCADTELKAVCKLRYLEKEACDEMAIKNFEAIMAMSQSIIAEREKDVNNAVAFKMTALEILEHEIVEYLGGIAHVANVDPEIYGFAGLGEPL